MELYLGRIDRSESGTTGLLWIDDAPSYFTVERPWMENQRGISCIPEGKYEVAFREYPTKLTMAYREKFDFFKWHLESTLR